jgi:hypothetical protein
MPTFLVGDVHAILAAQIDMLEQITPRLKRTTRWSSSELPEPRLRNVKPETSGWWV